jgi:hypothetical protein
MDAEEVERFARPLLTRANDPDRAAETAWLLAYHLQRSGRSGESANRRRSSWMLWRGRVSARHGGLGCTPARP